jgi:outer membrane protein assembly factor BamA
VCVNRHHSHFTCNEERAVHISFVNLDSCHIVMMKTMKGIVNRLPITLGLLLLLLPMLLQHIIDITVVSALNPSWRSSSSKFWNEEERRFPNLLRLFPDSDEHDDPDVSLPTRTKTQTHTGAAHVRGGSSSNNKANKSNKVNKVLQGSKSTIASTMHYWSDAAKNLASTLTQPIRNIRKPTFLQSKATRRHNELLQRLQTTPIENVVIVPNSTVVPHEVLQIAAKRAGLLGRPLQTQAVQEVARSLQQWYERKGYVLHSMTGATLQVETKTAELSVQEPVSSTDPVSIIFCKEMVIDPDDGSLLTLKQYRHKLSSPSSSHNHKSVRKFHRTQKIDRSSLNTTFVPIPMGRTNPNRIATALGMRAGAPFCWNPDRWKGILRSGLFQRTIRATPERMADGSVQLQLVVQEAPARNLEYGLTKSLYTDSWEGEIDFHHRNLLGGGESLGVLVRRGTHDAEPSIRVRFRDDKFGTVPGGYDVELFSDFIGEHLEEKDGAEVEPNQNHEDYDYDELLDRKGVSMSIRSPLSSLPVANSGSATLERTSTKGGRHESVGSATLNLGPISSDLPLDARTSVFGKVTTGTRIGESSVSSSGFSSLLPFASMTATTRQIFPLSDLEAGPLVLALQHSATASTRHLPRHEANAHGVACKIRGYQGGSHSERVSNSLVGTTELRIPLKLPRGLEEASFVVFGDWCLASAGMNQKFKRRSSVGVSLRKTFQGLPIKYDISLTEDRKIGAFFGLGPDFQA